MLAPSRYRIIAIGKTRKPWIKEGINLYLKRLPGLTITELRDSNIEKEAQSIHSSIRNDELVIALAEEGEQVTLLAFTQRLQTNPSTRYAFLIGGANGLHPKIKEMANWRISLSPLTLPHEIARLLLVEQLYRATTIANGSPYHRK